PRLHPRPAPRHPRRRPAAPFTPAGRRVAGSSSRSPGSGHRACGGLGPWPAAAAYLPQVGLGDPSPSNENLPGRRRGITALISRRRRANISAKTTITRMVFRLAPDRGGHETKGCCAEQFLLEGVFAIARAHAPVPD